MRRTPNAEGAQSRSQRGRRNPKEFGRTTRTVDLPVALFERGNEVGPLSRPSLRLGLDCSGLRRPGHSPGRCPDRHIRHLAAGLRQHRIEREPVPPGEYGGALDHVRKLAHVAGPLVLLELTHVARREAQTTTPDEWFHELQDVRRERSDVVAARPQRWDLNRKHGEPVE